jgi:chromosome segregation protein
MASVASRLSAVLGAGCSIAEALEPRLRARADAGSVRTGALATRLRELGAAEAELRRAANDASERTAAIEAERAGVEAELREARRRLEEAGAEPGSVGERDELVAKLERLERRREELGRVNPFAKEEYEQEKARLDELSLQREDLECSLAELEQLRAELTETVERRFTETFAAVQQNFAEAAASLFPGGEGRLRLTEADDGAEEAGVEVELRPAGKRNTRLSLLSGGEKALGAIAFLFALFLARPCAFYLLDEVEAALDDPNIGRFVELLRTYADRAQFIVITHQKRTMEAADILYGVTMGANGVSEIVSRRMAAETQTAVA